MLIKLANGSPITLQNIKSSALDCDDPELIEYFKKTAADLKVISPKANDFLYFTCIMMHAAEASLIDDNGNLKKLANGQDVHAHWEERKDGAWIWRCNDPNIKPTKNSNSDIFPRAQLKLAYKKWVGKPLCLDHQSQSVDHIRGVIVDTVYDDKFERIIALCALDKINYPDLARKVATGYSSSVSMGVAVGQAICSEEGCHRVARIESEFCDHMKRKSCYGEININLSPIELSLVVNPADPKAKIRRIIASAGSVAEYVDANSGNNSSILELNSELKNKLEKLEEELSDFSGDNLALGNEEEFSPYGQPGRGTLNMAESSLPNTEFTPQAIAQRYASSEDVIKDLKETIAQLDIVINKMASIKENDKTLNKENTMGNEKRAYLQGGGGANEPARGQVKYPIDPTQDQLREKSDKQMTGQTNLGPVDGMNPGYDSFGESEEARKKRLQRLAAEQEERNIRRLASLERAKLALEQKKEAYLQGGGGANEPTPGKAKYPVDPTQDQLRDKTDKQMTGEKPFPGVGPVDGVFPGDETLKKEIQRAAKLTARFVKAANADGSENQASSRWDIYAKTDDKARLVLSATVKDLVGDRVSALYDAIATEDYGKKMIKTIRTAGLEKATSIFKGAQEIPALTETGIAPGAAVDAGGLANVPPSDKAPEYAGEGGDPVEQIESTVKDMGNLQAELSKAVEALKEEEPAVEVPGAEGEVSLPRVANVLRAGLIKAAEEILPRIKDSLDEASLIQSLYKDAEVTSENRGLVTAVTKDALIEAKSIKDDALNVMASFVRYTKASKISKKAEESTVTSGKKKLPKSVADTLGSAIDLSKFEVVSDEEYNKHKADTAKAEDGTAKPIEKKKLPKSVADTLGSTIDPSKYEIVTDDEYHKSLNKADDCGYAADKTETTETATTDKNCASDPFKPVDTSGLKELKENQPLKALEGPKVDGLEAPRVEVKRPLDYNKVDADFDPATGKVTMDIKNATREERDALRISLAQKGLQFSEMLQKSNPSGVTPKLDVKPAGDLAKIETPKELHEAMMNILPGPKNVREAAESIQSFIAKGEIDAKDVDALVALGVDSEAVSYWKKYFGEAKDKEASTFAADLVKDYASKKKASAEQEQEVKISRSYELAHDMAKRGFISNDRNSIKAQAKQLMNYSDENFVNFQNTVLKMEVINKQASIPVVGSFGLPDLAAPETNSMKDELEVAFLKSTRRNGII